MKNPAWMVVVGVLASGVAVAAEGQDVNGAVGEHSLLTPTEKQQIFAVESLAHVTRLSKSEMTETVGGSHCHYSMSSDGMYQKYCPKHK